jgi:ATP-dependent DNA ligase
MPHINKALESTLCAGIALDGELWGDGLSFDQVQVSVLHGSQDAPRVGLWVFDVSGRKALGGHLARLLHVVESSQVHRVETAIYGESEAKDAVRAIIASGAEGAVMRSAAAAYSAGAWKVKAWQDSEVVLRAVEDNVLVCEDEGGPVRVMGHGNIDWQAHVGGMVTVRHLGRTCNGVLRHASAPRVRLEA